MVAHPLMLEETQRNKPASYNLHSKTHSQWPKDLQQAPQSEDHSPSKQQHPGTNPWTQGHRRDFQRLKSSKQRSLPGFRGFSRAIQPQPLRTSTSSFAKLIPSSEILIPSMLPSDKHFYLLCHLAQGFPCRPESLFCKITEVLHIIKVTVRQIPFSRTSQLFLNSDFSALKRTKTKNQNQKTKTAATTTKPCIWEELPLLPATQPPPYLAFSLCSVKSQGLDQRQIPLTLRVHDPHPALGHHPCSDLFFLCGWICQILLDDTHSKQDTIATSTMKIKLPLISYAF